MSDKLFKNILLCVSVIFFVIAAGCTAYIAAVNFMGRNSEPNSAEAVISDAAPVTPEPAAPSSGPSEYYIARLNGDDICIYLVYQKPGEAAREKFLYSFDVYRGGIPESDISDLTRGIILKDRESLASFEEDFGS